MREEVHLDKCCKALHTNETWKILSPCPYSILNLSYHMSINQTEYPIQELNYFYVMLIPMYTPLL